MPEICELRAHATSQLLHCSAEQCVYWRVLEHVDVNASRTGCAIQYFSLLEGGAGISSWLLSVKDRLESGVPAENPLDSLLSEDPGAPISESVNS